MVKVLQRWKCNRMGKMFKVDKLYQNRYNVPVRKKCHRLDIVSQDGQHVTGWTSCHTCVELSYGGLTVSDRQNVTKFGLAIIKRDEMSHCDWAYHFQGKNDGVKSGRTIHPMKVQMSLGQNVTWGEMFRGHLVWGEMFTGRLVGGRLVKASPLFISEIFTVRILTLFGLSQRYGTDARWALRKRKQNLND